MEPIRKPSSELQDKLHLLSWGTFCVIKILISNDGILVERNPYIHKEERS